MTTFHKDFQDGLDLMGKCLDLESAYKQLPVKLFHAHLSICVIKNPHQGNVEFFELHALPFGASAAVHGFNRAAMAIEHILTKLFWRESVISTTIVCVLNNSPN